MSVYFARRADGIGPIKVGASDSARSRVECLGKRMRVPLVLLTSCRGGNWKELQFHALYEPYHIGGEWFEPLPAILEAVEQVATGVFDWDRCPEQGWAVTKPFQCKASISFHGRIPSRPTFAEYRAERAVTMEQLAASVAAEPASRAA